MPMPSIRADVQFFETNVYHREALSSYFSGIRFKHFAAATDMIINA